MHFYFIFLGRKTDPNLKSPNLASPSCVRASEEILFLSSPPIMTGKSIRALRGDDRRLKFNGFSRSLALMKCFKATDERGCTFSMIHDPLGFEVRENQDGWSRKMRS